MAASCTWRLRLTARFDKLGVKRRIVSALAGAGLRTPVDLCAGTRPRFPDLPYRKPARRRFAPAPRPETIRQYLRETLPQKCVNHRVQGNARTCYEVATVPLLDVFLNHGFCCFQYSQPHRPVRARSGVRMAETIDWRTAPLLKAGIHRAFRDSRKYCGTVSRERGQEPPIALSWRPGMCVYGSCTSDGFSGPIRHFRPLNSL